MAIAAGRIPWAAHASTACAPMAFREPLAVGAQNHGKVAEGGEGAAQGVVEENLFGRVGDVIVAAQHMGDLHGDVVGDHCKVVGGRAIAAQNDKVVDAVVLEADGSMYKIVPGGFALGNPEADGKGIAGLDAAALLGGRQLGGTFARKAGHALSSAGDRCIAGARELGLGGEVAVGEPPLQKLQRALPMTFGAMRLEDRFLVPVQSQPAQSIQELGDVLGAAAAPVGVLNAQQKGPALAARQKPVEERGAGATDMQRPGGRGSEAKSHAIQGACRLRMPRMRRIVIATKGQLAINPTQRTPATMRGWCSAWGIWAARLNTLSTISTSPRNR